MFLLVFTSGFCRSVFISGFIWVFTCFSFLKFLKSFGLRFCGSFSRVSTVVLSMMAFFYTFFFSNKCVSTGFSSNTIVNGFV